MAYGDFSEMIVTAMGREIIRNWAGTGHESFPNRAENSAYLASRPRRDSP
jgi:hypothetical protein